MKVTLNPKTQEIIVKSEENLGMSFAQIKNLIQSQEVMSGRSIQDMMEAKRYAQYLEMEEL